MENREEQVSSSTRNPKEGKAVLPGDLLGAEEEFEAGYGAASIEGNIVASRIGKVSPDMANRIMLVEPAKREIAKLPETGDYIAGTVQSAASSVAQVKIESINDIQSSKELSGMLSMRDERHRRSTPPVKAGDVIRAKVSSTTNSIYHLTLDGDNCGVLFTVCSFCGGRVVALGRGAVKCTECGSVDDRLLSDDFIAYSRSSH